MRNGPRALRGPEGSRQHRSFFMSELNGKVAVVTGASKGIGAAIAKGVGG
jgi:hypothetical protein